MARASINKCLLVLLLIAVLCVSLSEPRGGRGGGGRGGGYRGGSRSSRSSRSGRSGGSGSSSSAWRTMLVAGTLYGGARYMTRSRYRSDPYSRPTICENYSTKDGNGTVYGMFICPMWDQGEELDHCCGPEGQQRCCTYWDDPGRMAGAIIGFVLAGLLVVGILACVIKCCCCNKKSPSTTDVQSARVAYSAPAYAGAEKAQLPSDTHPNEQPPAYGFKDPGPQPPAYGETEKY